MTRHKPKVVIPSQFDALLATGVRVANRVSSGDSVIDGRPGVEATTSSLNVAIADANELGVAIVDASEAAQRSLSERNTAFSLIRDVLIVVRDHAIAKADGDRQEAGKYGFEVYQSRTEHGNAKVVIPNNADMFLALARRVSKCVSESADLQKIESANGLAQLIVAATANQETAINLRETRQLLQSRKRVVAGRITNCLRKIRNEAFAATGPGRYEEVSTTGLVVQSSNRTDNGAEPDEVFVGVIALPTETLISAFESHTDFQLAANEFAGQDITLATFVSLATGQGQSVEDANAVWEQSLTPA